jgi:hypothetical protein
VRCVKSETDGENQKCTGKGERSTFEDKGKAECKFICNHGDKPKDNYYVMKLNVA